MRQGGTDPVHSQPGGRPPWESPRDAPTAPGPPEFMRNPQTCKYQRQGGAGLPACSLITELMDSPREQVRGQRVQPESPWLWAWENHSALTLEVAWSCNEWENSLLILWSLGN